MSNSVMPARFVSRRLLCSFGLLTLGSLLLVGCGSGDNNGPVTSKPRSFSNLEFTLSAPKRSYQRGETITFTFNVKNNGTEAANFIFPTSGQAEFSATQNDQQVWFAPELVTGAFTNFALAVGQTKTFTADWTQKNPRTDQSVGAGTYQVDAWLLAGRQSNPVSPQDVQTKLNADPISITIE